MHTRNAWSDHGLAALIALLLLPGVALSAGKKKPGDYCPILDDLSDPQCQAGLTVVPAGRFEGCGASTMVELDGDWEFAYFQNVLRGDIDLSLALLDTIFVGSARLDLPSQLVKLAVDAGWAGRFENGVAVQARATPGLYGEPTAAIGRAFFAPLSVSVIRAFQPDLAAMVGLECRIGFEDALMPIVGFQWEAGKDALFKVGLPESKIVWEPTRDWAFRARFYWSNLSYRLDDDRDRITLEDFRLSLGGTYYQSGRILVMGEIGYAFDRNVEFQHMPTGEIGIEDMLFLRVGIGMPL
ncbi:MAG: hypothetical protein QME60_09105 [Verrucomicrobiota bacterium]|nr:hypothetical protein [Verrucomicrobiota bacterium]